MRINLHIDQIVVDGATLTRRERQHLAETLEQELALQLRRHAAGATTQLAPWGHATRDQRTKTRGRETRLGARIAAEILATLPLDALPSARPPTAHPRGTGAAPTSAHLATAHLGAAHDGTAHPASAATSSLAGAVAAQETSRSRSRETRATP
jgi:hypothetical protein